MPRLLFACIVAVATLAGCQEKSGTGSAEVAERKTLAREEFKAKVIGKTPDAVIAAVGRPDQTFEGYGEPQWAYFNAAMNPATGKPGNAMVKFKAGVVDDVAW